MFIEIDLYATDNSRKNACLLNINEIELIDVCGSKKIKKGKCEHGYHKNHCVIYLRGCEAQYIPQESYQQLKKLIKDATNGR